LREPIPHQNPKRSRNWQRLARADLSSGGLERGGHLQTDERVPCGGVIELQDHRPGQRVATLRPEHGRESAKLERPERHVNKAVAQQPAELLEQAWLADRDQWSEAEAEQYYAAHDVTGASG
jgi:hypothetical protein